MKANYIDYCKLYHKLYCNVPLTQERLSDNALKISQYLVKNGALEITRRAGLGIRTTEQGGEVVNREIVYLTGDRKGQALTFNEIERIGLLLLRPGHYTKREESA